MKTIVSNKYGDTEVRVMSLLKWSSQKVVLEVTSFRGESNTKKVNLVIIDGTFTE